jgi:hypothetical protein
MSEKASSESGVDLTKLLGFRHLTSSADNVTPGRVDRAFNKVGEAPVGSPDMPDADRTAVALDRAFNKIGDGEVPG